MFHIALHEPKIAPNTGNIIRLVANNGCHLHLIEPMGFDLEEKKLRRAGLDYSDMARVSRHAGHKEVANTEEPVRGTDPLQRVRQTPSASTISCRCLDQVHRITGPEVPTGRQGERNS